MNPVKALVIYPNGSFQIETKIWDYETIVDLLEDANVEMVRLPPYGNMYVDDEGKLKRLKRNDLASSIYQWTMTTDDYIVGIAILFGPIDGEGDETSITDEALKNFSLCVSTDPNFFS